MNLPDAKDDPARKDFGRNGTYLVLRQLEQNVPGFWQFLDKVSDSIPEKRERLAASMVGRERNGTPLIAEHIPEFCPRIMAIILPMTSIRKGIIAQSVLMCAGPIPGQAICRRL